MSDRKQRVVIQEVASGYDNATSGVLQGSILGPARFSIFIKDIARNLVSTIRLYAAQTIKINKQIKKSQIRQTKTRNKLGIKTLGAFLSPESLPIARMAQNQLYLSSAFFFVWGVADEQKRWRSL